MPAQLDDPQTPHHARHSGSIPSSLPVEITPLPLRLRDGTDATLLPIRSPTPTDIPSSLLRYLHATFAAEIDAGQTYPMLTLPALADFGTYWFGTFAAVAVRGSPSEATEKLRDEGTDWTAHALGTFYVKPNYPGRSSHVCNAGFLVCPGARGKGVGRAMGEGFLVYAPLLGYSYSVFNLVYATNTASLRIWDGLGFDRIGRVPSCGNLKGHAELVDAIVFGKRLGPDSTALTDSAKDEVAAKDAVVDGV